MGPPSRSTYFLALRSASPPDLGLAGVNSETIYFSSMGYEKTFLGQDLWSYVLISLALFYPPPISYRSDTSKYVKETLRIVRAI